MAFNRDAFKKKVKKTSIAQTVANATTSTRTPGTEYLKRKGRAGYRFMPTLNKAKTAYYAPIKMTSWLNIEVQDNDETKMKRKPIFNSRHHLGTKSDIIERYIRFIDENSVAFDNFDEINSALENYKTTIRPSASRIAYALELNPDTKDEDGNPAVVAMGRMEIKNSVWNALMDYARDNDAHEEELTFDPFDSVDDGLWFICKYADNKYKVTIKESFPIPDEYLEMLENVPLLEDLLAYKQSDWEFQLEGLRNFDEEFKVGLFNSPEFKEIIEEVHTEVRDKLTDNTQSPNDTTETEDDEDSSLDEVAVVDDEQAKKEAAKKVQALIKANPELKGKRRLSKEMTSVEVLEVYTELQAMLDSSEDDDDDGLYDD